MFGWKILFQEENAKSGWKILFHEGNAVFGWKMLFYKKHYISRKKTARIRRSGLRLAFAADYGR